MQARSKPRGAPSTVRHIKRGQKVDGKVYKNCTEHSFNSDFIAQKHKCTIIRYCCAMMFNYAYTMYKLKVY
nr:MAG TPA: conotoxin [Caudoviricetes sp.]